MNQLPSIHYEPLKLLVTGGCGFIGSNFILDVMKRNPDWHVFNLDALTYAGNRDNLRDLAHNSHYTFIKGDTTDRALCDILFKRHSFDSVVHFAAESHVDRSITGLAAFVNTNVLGTLNLIDAARAAWAGHFKRTGKHTDCQNYS